jgi:3-hydroxyisobutyrate dehydrogenase-like beta-hydroxyacid dehydrogenase
MRHKITGWKIESDERERLLKRFPPRYARVVADHVTLRFGTGARTPLPAARSAEIIGVADDEKGVQALVLRIGGTTARGDGGRYHVTWSLASSRQAKESNDVIADRGWQPVDPPVAISVAPARWEG